ncbi:aldehyde-activating protein [Marinomonas sp. 42_23_T18]|nr:aldehyde-activating protein [Marinomonas sp. 42_23_T18]
MPEANCLCNKVRIHVEVVKPGISACHCDSCRGWGGGPLFAVQCGSQVTFEGAEFIQEYDSTAWAKRGFCKVCGTHLYFHLKKAGTYNMPVGIFKDLGELEMTMQYYIDKKPDYYCFTKQTETMTEAEILSYFADEI